MDRFLMGAALGLMYTVISTNWLGAGVSARNRETVSQMAFRVMLEIMFFTVIIGIIVAAGIPSIVLVDISGYLAVRFVGVWAEAKWLTRQ
jgi:hypothetical protein